MLRQLEMQWLKQIVLLPRITLSVEVEKGRYDPPDKSDIA
jgi:hypothetical protein